MSANKPDLRAQVAAGVLVVLAMVFTLRGMGRVWWCKVGDLSPWAGDIWSAHNSQHFLDPYTFTHVLHGVAFFGILWLVARKLSVPWRFVIALGLEAAWEIAENTEAVIQKYRESTISLDYYGDSVLNSVADVASCGLGFAIAASVPWWASVAFFAGTELFLAWWIRDSLLMNVLMLTYPLESVRQWQSGGGS